MRRIPVLLRYVDIIIIFVQATGRSDTSDVRQPYVNAKPPDADPWYIEWDADTIGT